MFKKLIIAVLILLFTVSAIPSRVFAADDGLVMRNVMRDTFFGGVVGALIGAGFMLMREKPEDHLNYIAFGAGAGIIAGAAIGMSASTRALAEIEGNKITLNVPELKTDLNRYDGERLEVSGSVDILRYRF